MGSQGKLIVASTRLPVTMTKKGEAWIAAQSPGGLVTALKSVAERRRFSWIGWPGTHVSEKEEAAVAKELKRHRSIPIFLSKADIDGFYAGFSNRVLWPLFHGLIDRVEFTRSAWKAYQRVNEMFAQEIAKQVGPNDIVWVHDYQLCLVPEMLRKLGLTCPIGFFLHIPFPSSEIYRTLPVRETLLRGLLGADLLGFHAYEYVSHFRKACLRVLGIESEPEMIAMESRNVRLGMLPIGIDPGEIREMAKAADARAEYDNLVRTYKNKKIVLGVDRLDYTKGIPDKLLAFEEFLKTHPKWRNKVVLIQVAAPSRENVDEYRQLKRQVNELVGRINGAFGSPSHTPIVYINQSVPRQRLVGMYQAADVALVTPIRDGMNLVALEYVAARGDQGGQLILSEFAGAANLLGGARLVSPYNRPHVAEVLAECLEAPAPVESFNHMLDFVNKNTSMVWANRFLDRLEDTVAETRVVAKRLRVQESPAAERLKRARSPLVLLDYDGTLRGYERKPSDAVPTSRIRAVLQELAAVSTVYIISGRSADILENWLGDLDIGLVCEHGFAMRAAGGKWENRGPSSKGGLKAIERLFDDFVRRTPGSMAERKASSIAWHYRSADPEYGTFQANELLMLLEDSLKRKPFNVLRGNRVIEVRHENVSKGHATTELLKRHAEADAVFCAGDDRTDEDMMSAISRSWRTRAVTCWVGGRNPTADFWVESSDALLVELSELGQMWARPARRGAGTSSSRRAGKRTRKSA